MPIRMYPTLEKYVPALLQDLHSTNLETLEAADGPGLEFFRQRGGCGLIVPQELGGLGLTATEATSVHFELGQIAPSVAVGTAMHNFSIASLAALATNEPTIAPFLHTIADDKLLVASAYAESGKRDTLKRPAVVAVRNASGWAISGSKKPCSLSRSAGVIGASVWLEGGSGPGEYGVALIPTALPGIRVKPFWGNSVLRGAQSDEVIFDHVQIDDSQIVRPESDLGEGGSDIHTIGLTWFVLLTSATYLGIAQRLVHEAYTANASKESFGDLVTLVSGARLALDRVAATLTAPSPDFGTALIEATSVRRLIEVTIREIAQTATTAGGGRAFITSRAMSYFASCLLGLSFHPPAKRDVFTAAADRFEATVIGEKTP